MNSEQRALNFLTTGARTVEHSTKASDSRDTLLKAIQEVETLRAFKSYVHLRLDEAGVPHDPEPENNAAHGCRVEGRLNFALRGGLYGHLPRCSSCGGHSGQHARQCTNARRVGL